MGEQETGGPGVCGHGSGLRSDEMHRLLVRSHQPVASFTDEEIDPSRQLGHPSAGARVAGISHHEAICGGSDAETGCVVEDLEGGQLQVAHHRRQTISNLMDFEGVLDRTGGRRVGEHRLSRSAHLGGPNTGNGGREMSAYRRA
jgi:hypothetical protein